MYDLETFNSSDMMRCRAALRQLREIQQPSIFAAADAVATHFFDKLSTGETDSPASVLVRVFRTASYSTLEAPLQQLARSGTPTVRPDTKCLILLATRGIEPEWNDRTLSASHRVIPLESVQVVERAPMISQLVQQLGVPVESVIAPDPAFVLDALEKSFNVFHIEHASGSAYVPAQSTFVKPYGVRSVLGFGGLLPSGDLFAIIVFSRVRISAATAQYFAPLALNVKLCLLPFDLASAVPPAR